MSPHRDNEPQPVYCLLLYTITDCTQRLQEQYKSAQTYLRREIGRKRAMESGLKSASLGDVASVTDGDGRCHSGSAEVGLGGKTRSSLVDTIMHIPNFP